MFCKKYNDFGDNYTLKLYSVGVHVVYFIVNENAAIEHVVYNISCHTGELFSKHPSHHILERFNAKRMKYLKLIIYLLYFSIGIRVLCVPVP